MADFLSQPQLINTEGAWINGDVSNSNDSTNAVDHSGIAQGGSELAQNFGSGAAVAGSDVHDSQLGGDHNSNIHTEGDGGSFSPITVNTGEGGTSENLDQFRTDHNTSDSFNQQDEFRSEGEHHHHHEHHHHVEHFEG
jgi:hypothetical protein